MKPITYYCPGCKKRITRLLKVAHRKYRSFCEKAGKDVLMLRVLRVRKVAA